MAKRQKTITIKLNRDGTTTVRSTGGVDLRKYFPTSATPKGTSGGKQESSNADAAKAVEK